jgi:membrane protease YdiL (CAAX protease family)
VKNLRPVDGILIFGISYLLSALAGVAVLYWVSPRTDALISTVVLVAVAVLLLRRRVGRPLAYVGLRPAGSKLTACTVLASLAMILPVMSLEAITVFRFKIPKELLDALDDLIRARTVPELLYVLLVVGVGAAVGEELVFRGVLQRSLAARLRPWSAVLITALVFAALHTVWRLPPALVLGVFLGFLYWRTQSLVLPMVAHFTINAASILVMFATQMRGEAAMPVWLREEKAAPVWMIGVSLAALVLLLRVLWREGAPEKRDGLNVAGPQPDGAADL